MITTRLRPHRDKLLLASIFIAFSTSTILWTLRDRTPPPWDPSDHLRYAYDYYRLLAHADFSGFAREVFATPHHYAPFVHLFSAAVFLVLGASRLTGIAVNFLSLAALLWAVAWISRHVYANSPVGVTRGDTSVQPPVLLTVLPGLIAASYHVSAWLMHDAFLDFPLTAIVTVSFALLIRADDFRVRSHVLAFAVAAGIGMLVKQTFAFFFVLPALYVVMRALWRRDRRGLVNLALAAVVVILVAAIWYGPHWHDVVAIYRENRHAAVIENEAPRFGFDSKLFYVHALISTQMQVPLALIFAVGLVYSLLRCRKQSLMLYLWMASGIACFTLVANKDVRYTAPVLPAAALISVCWLREFPRASTFQTATGRAAGALRAAVVAAIAACAFVSFWNAQWPRAGWGEAADTPRYRWKYHGFDHRPLDDNWSVPEIVAAVSKRQTVSPPVLGVVVNLPYLNPSSVALYARLLTNQPAGAPLIDVRWMAEPAMIDGIDACDYILVRTGLDQADWVASVERNVERLIRDHPDQFIRDASFPIPLAGAEAVVYRHEKR